MRFDFILFIFFILFICKFQIGNAIRTNMDLWLFGSYCMYVNCVCVLWPQMAIDHTENVQIVGRPFFQFLLIIRLDFCIYFFHFYFVVCDSKNRNRNFRFISIGNSDVFAVYAAGWWLFVTGWQIQNALACYISRFGIWQYYNFDDPNIKCYIKGLWSFTRVNTSWWKQSHFHFQNIECRTVIYDRSISACHRCQHKRNTALKNGKQQKS